MRADKWIPCKGLELTSNLTRIDTRDFNGYNDDCSDEQMSNTLSKIKVKYRSDNEDTCYTLDEIKFYLNKMYTESGYNVKWRFLSFIGDKRSASWIFKYLNIYKLKEDCFIIEGSQNDVALLLHKSTINKGVNLEYLNAH
jgi:hypothetical protein